MRRGDTADGTRPYLLMRSVRRGAVRVAVRRRGRTIVLPAADSATVADGTVAVMGCTTVTRRTNGGVKRKRAVERVGGVSVCVEMLIVVVVRVCV